MWLLRYMTGPENASRLLKPSTTTFIPSRSALVTDEKHSSTHFGIVSRPSGSRSALIENTFKRPIEYRSVVSAPGFALFAALRPSGVR